MSGLSAIANSFRTLGRDRMMLATGTQAPRPPVAPQPTPAQRVGQDVLMLATGSPAAHKVNAQLQGQAQVKPQSVDRTWSPEARKLIEHMRNERSTGGSEGTMAPQASPVSLPATVTTPTRTPQAMARGGRPDEFDLWA